MATATRTPTAIPLPSMFPGAPYPTAPLPPAALAALVRLELRVTAPGAIEAAARYGVASFRTAQLSRWMDTRNLSDAEFDDFEFAQDAMRESRQLLAAAGLLHLIGGV
jgi:hypothetical protein